MRLGRSSCETLDDEIVHVDHVKPRLGRPALPERTTMKRDLLPATPEPATEIGTFERAWRVPLVALGVALAAIGICLGGTAASMVRTWATSETFAHGFVVLPITLWLVWRIRHRLRMLTPRPAPIVLPLIAAAGMLWLVGESGAVNVLSQLGFVSMLVLAVPAILGLRVARAIMFPLGFLFFAVPIGDFLLPTLMDRTADFTVEALRASGVPVYREGLLMILPNGRWSIVEACSGVRYLIASLMVGTLFAYLNYRSNRRRWAFAGVAIAVPVVANWLRAYMIVMLGYLSDNRLAAGVDHLIYGWVFFGVVMLLMFWIGARWRERTPGPVAKLSPATTVSQPASWRSFAVVSAVVVAVAAIWPAAKFMTERGTGGSPIALSPIDVPGWAAESPPAGVWQPHFELPSATLQELLRRDGTRAGIYIAYYRNQDSRSKLVSQNNTMVTPENRSWVRAVIGSAEAPLGGGAQVVSASRLRGGGGFSIDAWQWYWINGSVTSSDVFAKARTAWLRLTGRSDDSAAIIVYVYDQDPHQAQATLQTLTRDAWPSIEAMLVRARGH